MAVLVLLNGPPASGKSTIAQRFVDSRPLSLNLDIDVVRGMLGGWLDDPSTAGLTARSLTLVMAEAHLAGERDVIVPQFLGRTDFIEQLASAADRSGATFVETALWIDRSGAIAAFADRRAPPSTQAHHDAAALVDRSEQTDPWARCTTRSSESSKSGLPLGELRSSPATSTRPSHALRGHSISAPRNPLRAGASAAHCGPILASRIDDTVPVRKRPVPRGAMDISQSVVLRIDVGRWCGLAPALRSAGAMNAQNIYDDPDFLAGYVTLDRQVRGLDGASEWPVLRSLLPDLEGRRVVDLGCGFGWFSRWADEHHAASVLGLDISTKMLDRARTDTASATVEYRRSDLDVLDLDPGSAELVFSSLTLHYIEHLDRLLETIALSLTPGGSLVFSVEHPILSAPSTQGFETSATGDRFWKLDNYLIEGERVRTWFVDGVVKQHRTVATYVNSVIGSGLTIERLVEWGPTPDDVEVRPELADDLHRPWFLLLAALKPGN